MVGGLALARPPWGELWLGVWTGARSAFEHIDKALQLFKKLGTFELQMAQEQAARIRRKMADSAREES